MKVRTRSREDGSLNRTREKRKGTHSTRRKERHESILRKFNEMILAENISEVQKRTKEKTHRLRTSVEEETVLVEQLPRLAVVHRLLVIPDERLRLGSCKRREVSCLAPNQTTSSSRSRNSPPGNGSSSKMLSLNSIPTGVSLPQGQNHPCVPF